MGVEVGGGVVTEELRVAEDEAGAVVVEGVPGEQGKEGRAQGSDQREAWSKRRRSGAIAEDEKDFVAGECGGCDDGSLLGEHGEGEEQGDCKDVSKIALGKRVLRLSRAGAELGSEIKGEGPQGEGSGEDVGVGEGALGEPDGVGGGQERDGERGKVSREAAGEAEDREQGSGGDDADERAGAADDKSGEVPPGGEEDGGEGGMGIGDGGVGDEGAGAQEVQGGGDVVAALVPEVREPEESPVAQKDPDKEEGVEHPELQRRRG